MKVTMLGSGTSSGVPRIGPDWGACDPADPRNRRRRVSLLVEHAGKTVLVDTGPDLREQLIDARVSAIDAVLYTHDHADHTHGIDDLRQVFHAMHRAVACYADARTLSILRKRFDYVFEGRGGYPPTCVAHPMPERLQLDGLAITPFEQNHGDIGSLGLRFEADGYAVVYSTDVKDLPEAAFAHLHDLDLWIVDALRRTPHPTHSHLEHTLAWIDRVRPRRAWLTHLDHSMDYVTLSAELPDGVEPGYDGLSLTL